MRELVEPTPVAGDAFAGDLGLSHDGRVLAVGAPLASGGAAKTGTAYVFRWISPS